GSESRGLLVPHQQVANARTVEGIVEGEDRPAREAKEHVHLLALQAFQQKFGTGNKLPHNLTLNDRLCTGTDQSVGKNTMAAFSRQPLFGNPLVVSGADLPAGLP